MDWYAIQVLTGKEAEVHAGLLDAGVETLEPYVPRFYIRGGEVSLSSKLLIPGYVFAKVEIEDFFKYKRSQRLERMMIRLCGNGWSAVPLSESDLRFLHICDQQIQPLCLSFDGHRTYQIVNPPPGMTDITVINFDHVNFAAKVILNNAGFLQDHLFCIAAFRSGYHGKLNQQIQDLLNIRLERFNLDVGQALT